MEGKWGRIRLLRFGLVVGFCWMNFLTEKKEINVGGEVLRWLTIGAH